MLSYRWRTRLVLLCSCAALALLAATPSGSAAPGEDCEADMFRCVEETLGIDLEIEVDDMPEVIAFGTRLVIYYWDGDCKYRQVVIVRVRNLPALQDVMRALGANEWNALGELSRDDYRALVTAGALQVLRTEPPEVEACVKDPGPPPCELPWSPIIIEVVRDPGDILIIASLEPIKDPESCFSVDLDRTPIFDPMPHVAVPFFFFDEKDLGRVKELFNPR